MSKSESPTDKDSLKKTSRPTIEELSGTLFMLAVVSDEDDAATLRADLKRSRLDEYKLQTTALANKIGHREGRSQYASSLHI